MAAGRFNDVAGSQKTCDFARFCGRLDNHESPDVAPAVAVVVSHLRLAPLLLLPGRPAPFLQPLRQLTISHPRPADANWPPCGGCLQGVYIRGQFATASAWSGGSPTFSTRRDRRRRPLIRNAGCVPRVPMSVGAMPTLIIADASGE